MKVFCSMSSNRTRARLSPRFLYLTSSPLLFSVSPFNHASIRPSVRPSVRPSARPSIYPSHLRKEKSLRFGGGGAVLIIRNRSLLFADNVSLRPRPRPPSPCTYTLHCTASATPILQRRENFAKVLHEMSIPFELTDPIARC